MFETDLEMDEEGMTVPYPPLFDDIRKNNGFIDVRGRPDLAAAIAESAESEAMKNLLIKLAQPNSKLFTIGCDLGSNTLGDDSFSHTAGGYIQIMNAAYAKRTPKDYARFAQNVAETLKLKADGYEWHVHFILKPVRFKLDNFSEMTGSLWIWFHAFSDGIEGALTSRESLIVGLDQSLTDESHLSLFDY